MKEQWRQQLRQKLADYRQPAPEVAWAEVEQAVAASRRRRILTLYVRRVAAAAAIVLAVGGGSWLLFSSQPDGPAEMAALNEQAEQCHEQIQTAISHEVERIIGHQQTDKALKPALALAQPSTAKQSDSLPPQDSLVSQETYQAQEAKEDHHAQEVQNTHQTQEPQETQAPRPLSHPTAAATRLSEISRKSLRKLTAKVYLSNGLAGSSTSSMFLSQTTGQLVVNGDEQGPKTPGDPQGPQGPQGNTGAPSPDAPDGSDSADRPNDGLEPTLPPAVEEVTKTVQTDEHAHHHQPIRFGVSLRYQLNRSWSIESGIVVSQHTSDFDINQRTTINDQQTTIGSTQAPPVTSRQRLVYVGIPLHLSYRIWGSRHFTLYASAGGTMEKMVWGRKDTDVTTSNGLKSHTRQSLSIKPLQLSVDGAIGAEYKFSNSFSLYAEPGLGYYFDNGSSVPTIYQERPLNFNLNFGLRFGINASR